MNASYIAEIKRYYANQSKTVISYGRLVFHSDRARIMYGTKSALWVMLHNELLKLRKDR